MTRKGKAAATKSRTTSRNKTAATETSSTPTYSQVKLNFVLILPNLSVSKNPTEKISKKVFFLSGGLSESPYVLACKFSARTEVGIDEMHFGVLDSFCNIFVRSMYISTVH